jgi:carboxylesterase type B
VVANETLLFVYEGLGSNPSAALYYAFVADVFGEHAFRVLAEYPPHRDNRTVLHSMSLLGTDYIMACPTRAVARAVPGSFLYYFDHVMSFSQVGWGANYTECWNLTCHGEELPFQFGSADMVIPNAYTVDEKALVKTMQSAWLNFVAAPTPMPWQPFGNATQAAMYFATPESQVARFPRQGKCDFFDSIGYGRAGRFVEALAALSR